MVKPSKSSPRPPSAVRPVTRDGLAAVTGGFLDSGPSDSNRVIERHELPGNQGGGAN